MGAAARAVRADRGHRRQQRRLHREGRHLPLFPGPGRAGQQGALRSSNLPACSTLFEPWWVAEGCCTTSPDGRPTGAPGTSCCSGMGRNLAAGTHIQHRCSSKSAKGSSRDSRGCWSGVMLLHSGGCPAAHHQARCLLRLATRCHGHSSQTACAWLAALALAGVQAIPIRGPLTQLPK